MLHIGRSGNEIGLRDVHESTNDEVKHIQEEEEEVEITTPHNNMMIRNYGIKRIIRSGER